MPTIDVNGETLNYVRSGKGEPLVLVHSLGTATWMWDDQIREWSNDFEVVAFDARGHGKSTNNGGFSLEKVAGDIYAALQDLDLLPAHFVGISMGGIVLAHLSKRHPDSVRSLVIADSFATQGAAGAARAEALHKHISSITMEQYGTQYADETILPETPRSYHAALAKSTASTGLDNYLQTVQSIFTSDVQAEMKAMKAPVLVVCGDKDNRTPPSKSEEIAALVVGAKFELVPDAAHLSNLDNPEGFNRIVGAFLREQAQ